MTSSKPYLLRALLEWILDNDATPHLIVDAEAEDVDVPRDAVQDGRVVLNISPTATRNLEIDDEFVGFQARFGGMSREIWLPMHAVLAIYARENGQGMIFPEEEDTAAGEESPPADADANKTGKPHLKIIK